ncbi:hypothetical protein D3C87_1926160 [compost metagenome]
MRSRRFIAPRQFGPSSVTPASRALRASMSCMRTPPSPASAKPEVKTTAARVPLPASCAITSWLALAGTATMARSTGSPMSASEP